MRYEFLFRGRLDCGCVVAAGIDDPKDESENSRFVLEMLRSGYSVDRIPNDDGFNFKKCEAHIL